MFGVVDICLQEFLDITQTSIGNSWKHPRERMARNLNDLMRSYSTQRFDEDTMDKLRKRTVKGLKAILMGRVNVSGRFTKEDLIRKITLCQKINKEEVDMFCDHNIRTDNFQSLLRICVHMGCTYMNIPLRKLSSRKINPKTFSFKCVKTMYLHGNFSPQDTALDRATSAFGLSRNNTKGVMYKTLRKAISLLPAQ